MYLFRKSIPVMGKYLNWYELDGVWYTSKYVNVM